MSDQTTNYPDLLGAVTGGQRLNLDVVQCAAAARPVQVKAGHTFDLLLLLQNASDAEVDVVVKPVAPGHDHAQQKGRFAAKTTRLVVGLRPAEVGFVAVPISTSPLTQPGPGYQVGVQLEIKKIKKKATAVRAASGGGIFTLVELPHPIQQHLKELRTYQYSVDTGGKKNQLLVPFEVQPPALTRLSGVKDVKARYVCLWTLRDFADDYTIAQRVHAPAMRVVSQARREQVFMPLLKTTQERFEACHYPLLPPEAICITKLLTLVLETGITEPSSDEPRPDWPHWFTRMCRILVQEPAMADQIEALLGRLIYPDLIYDAVLLGFSMVSTVTNESFGTPEETDKYAQDIVAALSNQLPLDFARAYLPLALGGLIANARVTMPREQVRETIFMLSKALDRRRTETTDDNRFVFEIADQLIERGLDAI